MGWGGRGGKRRGEGREEGQGGDEWSGEGTDGLGRAGERRGKIDSEDEGLGRAAEEEARGDTMVQMGGDSPIALQPASVGSSQLKPSLPPSASACLASSLPSCTPTLGPPTASIAAAPAKATTSA